jgi:DNA-binding NarL/FixJ family response regulator
MTPGVRTVLVCDDQKSLRDAVSLLVAHFPRFRVIGKAVDGRQCVELLAAFAPDILITDVNSPGRGAEWLRGVRSSYPNMHIVVHSGMDDVALMQQMMDAGADVYVLKTGRLKPLIDALDHGAAVQPPAHGRVEDAVEILDGSS